MVASKLRIHHSEWCRSLRPIWLLAELKVEFDIVAYKWDDLQSPEFQAVNPDGKIPVLEDENVKMVESGAITQFLAEKYGSGKMTVQPGTPEHATYCQWFHIAESSFMGPGPAALFHWNIGSDKDPKIKERALKNIDSILKILEKDLAKPGDSSFLVTSHPTAADFMIGYPLLMLEDVFAKEVDLTAFPKTQAYIKRLRSLPSAQATFTKYNSLSPGTHHIAAGSAMSRAVEALFH